MNDRVIKNLKINLKQNKLAILAIAIIVIFTIASVFAFLSPYDPNQIDPINRLLRPSLTHLFGTDDVGRDYFTRSLYGGRISLMVGFMAMIISTLVGTIIGAISGYFGGKIDDFIMRSIDILMCIPTFFLILVINSYLGASVKNLILIIGFLGWMSIARIVRGETLSVKEREYVLYAKASGQSSFKIITKHIIPSILPTIIVSATINIATAILLESSLSFLGVGVTQPNASWGSMLKDAQSYLMDAPYLAFFPGMFILLTVLSFNLIGDVLRNVFDPKANDR
ncbi:MULTISPECIES: ABC transporter permease [Paraclostridium]|uniref:Peptide ABC transporter permease n=4 Tax=Bacteria TaxID=2 RepID=A0A0M3DCW1_9FIRM|nr:MULTISPECIES: ABC transporter permease [Paraclostridium]MCU9807659.1 ABC transporter permease [Paraclostridium sp. AKS46]MDV8113788.1 ABC transporter permease [Bacillus sp. BAU-SS-2023]EQK43345.1 binding--dependent transport system inner membrane component family protein [[Clostridium] bifermentans ATCC 638] [Paraclostridium bifermentans ATCC 638 = DSM 14991]KKY00475.1 peptide ABC transporter permease [Paraclostridium benzoelyticum]MBN8047680.1 ABC transporter permease [Paraclostridium bife